MTLDARMELTRGDFRLRLDVVAAEGEVLALLGPNGAGKTTALRALSGLAPLASGHIIVDGHVWDRPPATFVAPERRRVGVVFQDYLLFRHLSVVDNVAFGLRARGVGPREAADRALEWLETVGLTAKARTKPGRLSGGQAQRVALARALATRPRLLLLDEPLSALDARTRVTVRSELKRHVAAFNGATVMVTHDPLDAMVLADRLVVLENGVVVQSGRPLDVAREPHTPYVADLVGLNLYDGTAADGRVRLDGGVVLTVPETLDGEVKLVFPPTAVRLHPERPGLDNVWCGTVHAVEQHAHHVRVHFDGPLRGVADTAPSTIAALDPLPGRRLWLSVAGRDVHGFSRNP